MTWKHNETLKACWECSFVEVEFDAEFSAEDLPEGESAAMMTAYTLFFKKIEEQVAKFNKDMQALYSFSDEDED